MLHCWLERVEQLGKKLARSLRRKDSQCESQGEMMADGLLRIVVINIQLSTVSYSVLTPPFPTLKASVKICHCKDLPRDVLGVLGQNGRSGAVLSLDQSSEEGGCWPLELRELVWRQATQRQTQENISLSLGILRGYQGECGELPLTLVGGLSHLTWIVKKRELSGTDIWVSSSHPKSPV